MSPISYLVKRATENTPRIRLDNSDIVVYMIRVEITSIKSFFAITIKIFFNFTIEKRSVFLLFWLLLKQNK